MEETISKFKSLIDSAHEFFYEKHDFLMDTDTEWMYQRPGPEKWSKIEILGHLIDSGVNNLQRFTEIQFSDSPYQIRTYQQNELVKANQYQEALVIELVDLWITLNERVLVIMENQDGDSLSKPIILPSGDKADLRFLMKDYVRHLEHHLGQILD